MGEFLLSHWIDILSTCLGLAYIILEYRASIALWVVGIIMPAIDIYLFYSVGLYADFGMAIYYTLAAIYGYAMWKFSPKTKETKALKITHISKKKYFPMGIVFLLFWTAIYFILKTYTPSNVPLTDSFINALSIIALWALAHKYIEQWFIWIVVDIVSSVLYAYKGIPFKASLYALYVVIAIFGYIKWKRLIKR
ncbi:MAG: nicotinamide riboside transporter PnuC [Prevotella sp.]|nr:nicotinamide riboside transporter PnuC [Prevotella sp.]